MGLLEGHWQFFPSSTSSLSSEPQRLFSLSLEDPVSWKPHETRGLTPVSDLKNRNLSLGRRRGDGGDRGDYVCTLKFNNSLTLKRTVRVNVLEGKWRRAARVRRCILSILRHHKSCFVV